MTKPILGITMGDPSGNGPELSVKVLMKPATYERCRPVIVGDTAAIQAAIRVVPGAAEFRVNGISQVSEAKFTHGTIDVLEVPCFDISKRRYKKDRQAWLEKFSPEEVEAQIAALTEQLIAGEITYTTQYDVE